MGNFFELGVARGAIEIDSSSIDASIKSAQQSLSSGLDSIGDSLKSLGSGISGLGSSLTVLGAPFAALGAAAVKAFSDSQASLAQLDAVLKSTGGSAGVTHDAAVALASSLQDVTRYSDEAILGGENLLLTFTNIGAKGGVFDGATQAILDMSTAMGTDLKSSAVLVGKALNDPLKGLTALTRVGVTFTQQQKDQIKAMVEAGDVMGAQKIILEELNKEFGGSAVAAGQTFAGALDILHNKFDDMLEVIGAQLVPIIQDFAGVIGNLIDWFTTLDPGIQHTIIMIGALMASLAVIGPVLIAIGMGISALGGIIEVLAIGIGVLMSPIGLVIAALVGLYVAFQNNFLGIRDLIQPVVDAVSNGVSAIQSVINGAIAILQGGAPGGTVNLFDYIFGTDDSRGGIQYILQRFGISETTATEIATTLRNIADTIRTGIDGIKLIFTGDFTAGMFGGAQEDSPIVSYWLGIHDNLKTALDSIPKLFTDLKTNIEGIDLSTVGQNFSTGLNNLFVNPDTSKIDFSGLQKVLTDNLNTVIDGALAGIAIVAGGPVSIGISVAKVVSDAIANDFLGLGTLLKETGIGDSITQAIEGVKKLVTDAMAGIFSPQQNGNLQGGDIAADMLGQIDTGPIIAFGLTFKDILDKAFSFVNDIGTNLGDDLAKIGTGIKGFIDNLSGADTSGLPAIALFLGGVAGGVIKLATDITGTIASTLEDVLPRVGTAVKTIIDTLSDIGNGNWAKVLPDLGANLKTFADALLHIPADIAGGLIKTLKDLTGIDISPEFVTAIMLIAGGLGALQLAATGLPELLEGIATAFGTLEAAAALLFSPVVLLVGAIVLLVGAVQQFYKGGIIQALKDAGDSAQKLGGIVSGGLVLAFYSLQDAFDTIGQGLHDFLRDAELKILDFAAGMKDKFAAIGIDILPDVDTRMAALKADQAAEQVSKDFTDALHTQLDNNKLDLSQVIQLGTNDAGGSIISGRLGGLLEDPTFVENLSHSGKRAIEHALQMAMETADVNNLPTLLKAADILKIDTSGYKEKFATDILPAIAQQAADASTTVGISNVLDLANMVGIDREGLAPIVTQALQNAITEGSSAQFQALVPLATELGIDTNSLTTQFETGITSAAGSKTYDAKPVTNTQVGVDQANVSNQFQTHISSAAGSHIYSATTTAAVTVTPSSVNVTAIQTAMQRAINGIMNFAANPGAGISNLISGLTHPAGGSASFRDSGGDIYANLPYLVGKPQQGNELFVPSQNGTAIPDFMKNLAAAGAGGGGGGDTHNYYNTIYANSHAEGAAAAEGFDERMKELRRARG